MKLRLELGGGEWAPGPWGPHEIQFSKGLREINT